MKQYSIGKNNATTSSLIGAIPDDFVFIESVKILLVVKVFPKRMRFFIYKVLKWFTGI
jgi:hypothetical protein